MNKHSTPRHTISFYLWQAGYTAPRDFRITTYPGAIFVRPIRHRQAVQTVLAAHWTIRPTFDGSLEATP